VRLACLAMARSGASKGNGYRLLGVRLHLSNGCAERNIVPRGGSANSPHGLPRAELPDELDCLARPPRSPAAESGGLPPLTTRRHASTGRRPGREAAAGPRGRSQQKSLSEGYATMKGHASPAQRAQRRGSRDCAWRRAGQGQLVRQAHDVGRAIRAHPCATGLVARHPASSARLMRLRSRPRGAAAVHCACGRGRRSRG
jgi:hypothetical protein